MNDWLVEKLAGESAELLLFVSAFLSSTLMPGGSEVILAGAAAADPAMPRLARLLFVAVLGNTLGAMTSWAIGRFLPNRTVSEKAESWLRRWGQPALLLSWLPVIGDALPLAAGWLRMNGWTALAWIALGKCLRYTAVLGAALSLI